MRPAQWTSIIGNTSLVVFMRVSLLGPKVNLELLHREFRHLETSEKNFTQVNDKSGLKGIFTTVINKMLCYVFLGTRKELFGYRGYQRLKIILTHQNLGLL
jgi:hypothetical protein